MEQREKTLEQLDHVKDAVQVLIDRVEVAEEREAAELSEETLQALREITREFGTEKYEFNLSLEYFVEKTFRSISDVLEQILKEAMLAYQKKAPLEDAAFAAYYALSLIYKKTEDLEGLRSLAEEIYEDAFYDYPLYNEVFSRYYKRTCSREEYREALDHDRNAIRRLGKKGIRNPGVCCSFASTVCMALESDPSILEEDDLPDAVNYIEEAIAENPRYPKYYYIKAKLDFYAGISLEGQAFDALCKRVLEDLQEAESYLEGKRVYRKAEKKEYKGFRRKVREIQDKRKHPRFTASEEELERIAAELLTAQDEDRCYVLPPVPAHRAGDRYFFVCYSSRDFRSVYYDLLELYRRKVPFLYDEMISSGEEWYQYVKECIADENCAGVVFYLSKNVLNTDSFCQEIKLVKELKKKYFCVNLEGKLTPSEILIEIILERCKIDERPHRIRGEQMRTLLDAFDDKAVFTSKFGDQDTRHFKKYLFDITTRFEELTIGE